MRQKLSGRAIARQLLRESRCKCGGPALVTYNIEGKAVHKCYRCMTKRGG